MTSQEHTVALACKLMAEYVPLPAQKIDGLEIKNTIMPAGAELMVIGLREALFSGKKPVTVKLLDPYTVQTLVSEKDGTWMSNLPCELVQQFREFAVGSKNVVLIGGLGLGAVASMCQKRREVLSVHVVENDPAVVTLNANRALYVVRADLFDVVRDCQPGEYDQLYIDIHQGTGEWVWQSMIVPLRRLAYGKIPRVRAWQEAVMHGQVRQGLLRSAAVDPERFKTKSNCHWYAFGKAVAELKSHAKSAYLEPNDFEGLNNTMQKNEASPHLNRMADRLLGMVGSRGWETAFGKHWDSAWEVGGED